VQLCEKIDRVKSFIIALEIHSKVAVFDSYAQIKL